MPPAATTAVSENTPAPKAAAVEIDPATLNAATVTTMTEVRIGIDDLDRRIVTLLGLSSPHISLFPHVPSALYPLSS